jgi:hypothetical protein
MAKRASGRPSKVLPPGVVASQRELAQAINVSARTIESWRKSPFERGMPMREDGTYSIAEVLQWKARRDEDARARKEAGKAKPSDGVDPDDLDLVKRTSTSTRSSRRRSSRRFARRRCLSPTCSSSYAIALEHCARS